MIDYDQLWLFWLATMALNLTPGADMIYIAAMGLGRGRKAGAVSAIGVGFGAVFHACLAAVGVSALIATSEVAYDVLRIAGAGYLIWLGIRSFQGSGALSSVDDTAQFSSWGVFSKGLVTNILNPKVALFFIAFLPQFIQPELGNVALQIVILGLLFGLNGTVINIAVGIFAGGAGQALLKSEAAARWVSRVSGTLLVALGVRLFLLEKS